MSLQVTQVKYCEGHISPLCRNCDGCLSDWRKDLMIKDGLLTEDGLRNKDCLHYYEITLHIVRGPVIIDRQSRLPYTAETENS